MFGKNLGVCSYVVLPSDNVTYRDNVKCVQLSLCFKPNDDNIISILLNTVLYYAIIQSNITKDKCKVTALHNVNFRHIMQKKRKCVIFLDTEFVQEFPRPWSPNLLNGF